MKIDFICEYGEGIAVPRLFDGQWIQLMEGNLSGSSGCIGPFPSLGGTILKPFSHLRLGFVNTSAEENPGASVRWVMRRRRLNCPPFMPFVFFKLTYS